MKIRKLKAHYCKRVRSQKRFTTAMLSLLEQIGHAAYRCRCRHWNPDVDGKMKEVPYEAT